MIKFNFQNKADEYLEHIESFLRKSFLVLHLEHIEETMELVTEAFISTKEHRIGPRPNPESLVLIREVIRKNMEKGKPIPILIAAAAIKVPVGKAKLDLAEFAGLKTLSCLQNSVKEHYAPGFQIRIRLEDLVERMISSDVPGLEDHIEEYVRDFRALNRILETDKFIEMVRESELTDPKVFLARAEENAEIFYRYLEATKNTADENHFTFPAYQELIQAGWQGIISSEMREFFVGRYQRNYPDLDPEQYNRLMSRYLACVLTRKLLNASGKAEDWSDGQLEISMVPRLPYAPKISTRLYYRTIPRSHSQNHISWWCGKGVVKIGEDKSRLSILNWWDENPELQKNRLVISNPEEAVEMDIHYLLE